ncbi:MMPL family transporter [Ectobacillus panaciterrae]|uniref:MMPL family transporter n=1 Tax=Ectobacillus panaciterrae TaxID=363872 RepID=UPI00048C6E04|nr:MMPL family transporter [Ectobacillus panaciterrae]
MRTLLKFRWILPALWVALLVVLVVFSPDMGKLIRDKGKITVPEEYSSVIAEDILKHNSSEEAKTISAVLVFHNPKKIDKHDEQDIQQAINLLKAKKEKLGIRQITTHLDNEDIRKQLVSKDERTIITPLKIDPQKRSIDKVRTDLEKVISHVQVEHYITGERFIGEDVITNSQNGLHKTEIITVVFIFIILIVVFRSIIAPLVPLLTVGLAYVASTSIVAYLVDWFNFPLSNFTQIFMVAILFGIGTDYCILLLSRFREELFKHETVTDAIIRTYQTAGKTVFFSALAVLIGFVSIAFSKFSLYQSATGVVVGVVMLLIAFLTIVPFFMAVLGPRLFWPIRSVHSNSESMLWEKLVSFSLRKPFRALVLVAIIVVPFLISYNGKSSFNSLNEIGKDYGSVKGFNIIADNFGPGEVMPVKVVMESDNNLDSKEALMGIERISREIAKLPSVEKVRSVTRPLGDPIKDFYVTNQAKELNEGLGKGNDGLQQIQNGLNGATNSLASSGPQLNSAINGIDGLIDGTKQLQDGATQLQDGLSVIEKGMRDGSAGAGQLKAGIAQMRQKVQEFGEQSQQLVNSYENLGTELQKVKSEYTGIFQSLEVASTTLAGLSNSFTALESRYPEIVQEKDYTNITQKVNATHEILQGTLDILNNKLNPQMDGVTEKFNEGKKQINQAINEQQKLVVSLGQLERGAAQLEQGIQQAAEGQSQAINKLPQFSKGLSQIEDGQRMTKSGFTAMTLQLKQLQSGLDQSADSLGHISKGLGSAQNYLGDLTNSPDREMAGFYIPSQAFESKEFQQVFNNYLSNNKKAAKFDVILKSNPYSSQALDTTKDIKEAVERALVDTNLKGSKFGVSGVSAISADRLQASNDDYTQTVIYMLIGITLILIVLLRSLVMPLYLIISLVLCFISSLAINEVIFVHILGYDGVNWTMPFFGFVLLMTIGVDYSIFLMDRFNEYKGMPVEEAILLAMRNVGTVIFSAVIILGGTFAAMYPSGVLSLMQTATIVLSGLLLYTLVFLPLFIPAMVKLFGKANWFPFDRSQVTDANEDLRT